MSSINLAWPLTLLLFVACLVLTYFHNKRYYKYRKAQIDKDWADFKEMSDKEMALEFMRLDDHTPRFRRICHAMALRFADYVLTKDQVIDSRD